MHRLQYVSDELGSVLDITDVEILLDRLEYNAENYLWAYPGWGAHRSLCSPHQRLYANVRHHRRTHGCVDRCILSLSQGAGGNSIKKRVICYDS